MIILVHFVHKDSTVLKLKDYFTYNPMFVKGFFIPWPRFPISCETVSLLSYLTGVFDFLVKFCDLGPKEMIKNTLEPFG